MANYGETKGRTWMGSPAAQPANQAARQAGSLSGVPVEGSSSSLPLPSCSEHTAQGGIKHRKTMRLMLIQIQALLSSPVFSSLIHSPPLFFLVSPLSTSRLQLSVCKQIPAHVIRCLHHSSAFTAPSFLLPPSSLLAPPPACPPFTPRL